MKKLKVGFDNPEHGWIGISVSDGIDTIVINVDSKSCSFRELINALNGLFDERGQFTVTWLEEPVEMQWKFTKQEGELVFEFRRSLFAEPVFQFAGCYKEVCFPFWRALQSLKGRFSKLELENKIRDEFPFGELEILTANIKDMKSIDMSIEDGKIILLPVTEAEISLEQLLDGVTEENLHGETPMGT